MEIEIESLMEDLLCADASRAAAAATRVTRQPDVLLPAVLRAAADRKSTRDLQPVMRVLARIGPPAFDAVVTAWRQGEMPDWQLGRLLGVFDERAADRYASAAADPDRRLRGNGFSGLVRLRVDSDAGLRALVEAFSRGRAVYDYKAAEYARLLADSFRPRLRSLRRDPAESPRTRRGAMTALVAGGGADALDRRDQAAIERLIRVKIPHETPSLPSPGLAGWWLAVPGASYEQLFEVLGLHDRRPITVRGGREATEGGHDTVALTGHGTTRTVGRAFITPELDGWRLVHGPLALLLGRPWFDMIETIERLSARCGRAQFFFLDDAGGSDVWVVAEEGRVIRRYTAYDDPEWVGDPLPWETLAADDPEYEAESDDVPPNAGTAGAETACGHLSIDPGQVGPATRVRGHGWLALTEPDVGHGVFPGVLPL
ncbi:hypothetical protein [Streptomyces sp. ME18-1-4]|uniref:hypothetical protein n=1 Tax=Streptomyces sp. ME18-1-4 TaxID=3028685 RepID=UPI0029A49A5D|nr:hypothetical protein [Streptomyces sp. ME18-1-4]MDX3247975.1 hypothetical protein [Streptomyces sp. ME18-1-4]